MKRNAPGVGGGEQKRPRYEKLDQIDHALRCDGMYTGGARKTTFKQWQITGWGTGSLGAELVEVHASRGFLSVVNELLLNASDCCTRCE